MLTRKRHSPLCASLTLARNSKVIPHDRALIAKIAAEVAVICPRCKREAKGWPLKRGDRCSPSHWIFCIRNPEDITPTKET